MSRPLATLFSADGQTITFNPASDFIEIPGGAKKFAIRRDATTGRYWSLVNVVPPIDQSGRHPASTRNTLNLISSENLRDWSDHGIVLQHPDVSKHGYQYIEWQFDGNDIIAVSRTAFDDNAGGAANYHEGFLYGSGFSRIDRMDPATGAATVLATRGAGSAATAGWTNADSQQLSIGPDGRLYFSTAFGSSSGQGVFRLNADGTSFERFIARTGGTAPAAWDLNNARGVAWLGNRLFVSSRAAYAGTSRPIYEYASSGQLTRILRADLRAPQGLMTDGDELLVAGVPGTLTGIDTHSATLSQLVSGLPEIACMTAVEILGEIHVITYQHGVWCHRDSSALTRAFVPSNTNHASMVVIPETDPYVSWLSSHPALGDPAAAFQPSSSVEGRRFYRVEWTH